MDNATTAKKETAETPLFQIEYATKGIVSSPRFAWVYATDREEAESLMKAVPYFRKIINCKQQPPNGPLSGIPENALVIGQKGKN